MGPETFKSLLDLARQNGNPDLLIKDKNLIGLIMKKSLKVSPETNQLFLEELNKLTNSTKNICILLETDITYEFLYKCVVNSDLSTLLNSLFHF
jgi:hypothetical protein